MARRTSSWRVVTCRRSQWQLPAVLCGLLGTLAPLGCAGDDDDEQAEDILRPGSTTGGTREPTCEAGDSAGEEEEPVFWKNLSGQTGWFASPVVQDLDGDGREDLVTLTLRFSMFQALKILATKKIGIGIDFPDDGFNCLLNFLLVHRFLRMYGRDRQEYSDYG